MFGGPDSEQLIFQFDLFRRVRRDSETTFLDQLLILFYKGGL